MVMNQKALALHRVVIKQFSFPTNFIPLLTMESSIPQFLDLTQHESTFGTLEVKNIK